MNPRPSGRLQRTAAGRDLVLTRTFRADIDDVWASITESERTARWFASWTGEPGSAGTIRYVLQFEEGATEAEMRIDACEPPHHLAVSSVDEHGSWRLEATLSQDGDVTTLRASSTTSTTTSTSAPSAPGGSTTSISLVASRDGTPPPEFDDYYPQPAVLLRIAVTPRDGSRPDPGGPPVSSRWPGRSGRRRSAGCRC